ncbi:type I restriction enzyme, S subunit [Cruoricaptor ignavus]|uniref:Type I restriction enzyme, S subunit n=1 Tax=Cruoricaptor ignavus TaxID=1118202 RepID=A0A1M6HP16_9FLAO|nr:restriction endonuclease subunit S [Cruoricaptor ignavus]SHJ23876.1 type I restriction enzyme, S subunit [Cruoricaptor ignavus]
MENNWKEVKLGKFIKVKHGFAFPGTHITDQETDQVLVTPGNFHIGGGFKNNKFKYFNSNDYPESYILKEGDIVVTMTDLSKESDTLGYGAKIPRNNKVKFLHNQRVGLVEFKDEKEIHYDFVYWVLRTRSYQGYVVGSASGTSIMHTSPSRIEDYDFFLPPLPEQKAIASVLSSLDDKIDLLHQQNQTLEALAETLFRQWFVEEAKEDWEELPFSEWISETVGGDWGKETLQGEFTKGVYCIRGTDIADLLTGIPTKTPIRFVKEKKFQSIEPKEGDIIIEISGGTENQSTGRAYFINNEIKSLFGKDLVFSNFCRLIRIKDSNYSFFVYLYLKYLYDQDEFFNLENGSSGIKNLDYKSLLFENKYKMPKEDLVLKFNDLVSDSYKKINHNKFQIQTLTQLRDTLLPKLMSGEVRVKN